MTRKRVLILYTELAPYFLACLNKLVEEHDVEVDLVRWPVNREAPFSITVHERVNLIERGSMNREGMIALLEANPSIVLTSGWVDKDYLAVCKVARKRGIPTVMCSDTAWRGDLRQWVAVVIARFWLKSTFSHAWVSGEKQAEYARKLGFDPECIATGFYAADVDAFQPIGARLSTEKTAEYPHRFLCVARYIETKGHQYLCEAFAELADAGQAKDWELWCVGTGELFPMDFSHDRITHFGFTSRWFSDILLLLTVDKIRDVVFILLLCRARFSSISSDNGYN